MAFPYKAIDINISISLTPELIGLVKAKIDSGRYTSTSEVIREAPRLLERADQLENERVAQLRQAWREGVESGDAGPMDFGQLRQDARRFQSPMVAPKRQTGGAGGGTAT